MSPSEYPAPVYLVVTVLDWLSEAPTRENPKVRLRLLDTIYERKVFIVFGSVSMAMLATSAAVVTGALWPWLWLLADLMLLLFRLHVIRVCEVAKAAGRPRPFRWLMVGGMSWCAMVGLGCMASIMSGNASLAILAGVNVAAVIGAISSRNAPTPRYAILCIVLVGLPFGAATLVAPIPGAFIIGLQVPLHITGIIVLLMQNYASHVRLVRAELRNRQLARTDPLTRLLNRSALRETLALSCAALAGDGRGFAVLSIDLDGFKAVNDVHGHATGDILLVKVADRLRRGVRADDQVFRLGGDEFVVVMPGASEDEANYAARRLIEKFSSAFHLTDQVSAKVGISIGSAFAPADGTTPGALLARADQALYAVKRSGKGSYLAYPMAG